MTDPLDVLRRPLTPRAPDPAFAAQLRERIRRALTEGDPNSDTLTSCYPARTNHVPTTPSSRAERRWILTFSAERELMDNKFTVEYKLTIDGDKLKGKGAVVNKGEKREFDIEGKREKKDK